MSTTSQAAKGKPLDPLDPLRRYPIGQAMAYLSTSRASIYKLILRGHIKTITEAKRRYVPGSEIARLSSVEGAS